jgi:hypothetical protein
MDTWIQNLKVASPESYTEYFTDQVHGWMTSRYVISTANIFSIGIPTILLTLQG